jgi:hypothetical protein
MDARDAVRARRQCGDTVTSGPNIPDAQRKRPRLPGTTVAVEVHEALERHVRRTRETRSAVVERALRKELGLPVGGEEQEK